MAREFSVDDTGSEDFNDELPQIPEASGADVDPRSNPIDVEQQILDDQARREASLDLLEGLRAIQGSEAIRWKIYRKDHDDPQMNGYVRQCSTGQLSLDFIRDKCGPGTYLVRGYNTVTGKIATQRTLMITKDARQASPETQEQTGSPSSSGFSLTEFLAQQQARDQQFRRELQEAEDKRRREEEASADRRREERMDLLKTLAPLLAPVVQGMFARRESVADMIQGLAALKQLEGSQTPASAEQPDSLDKMMRVIDFVKESGIAGGGEGKTDLWDIAKEVIKQVGPGAGQALGAFAQMVQMRNAQAAQAPAISPPQMPGAVAPPIPLPAPAFNSDAGRASAPLAPLNGPIASAPPTVEPRGQHSEASVPTADSPSGLPRTRQEFESMGLMQLLPLAPMLPWLQGQIEAMLVRAARGSNPELYAEVMLDDLPDGANLRALAGVLASANWFQLLAQLDQRVQAHSPWFQALRDSLLVMLQEETGVAQGVQTDGGIDPATGRQTVNVQGPGNPPGEPLTDEEHAFDEGQES